LDVRFSLFSAGQVCVRLPLHARHVFFHERFAFVKVIQREAALLRWARIDFAAHSYDLVNQQHCTPRARPDGIPLSLPVCRRAAHGSHMINKYDGVEERNKKRHEAQTSRLLTSSLSLGVPVPRPTQ
jgi:hypothetical protein